MRFIDVQIGQKYWIVTQTIGYQIISKNSNKPYVRFEKEDYDSLLYCELKKTISKLNPINLDTLHIDLTQFQDWVNKICCFFNTTDDNRHDILWLNLSGYVYKSKDDYLVDLVKTKMKFCSSDKVTNIKTIEFDSFITEKIKESQEIYPEKWIL